MIISRTPFRISFFGGGTDYPAWVDKYGGAVLSSTFDKYSYISCRELPPFFDHNYRISYSRVENTKTIDEIIHPAIRAILKESNFSKGLEIHCDADLPARSGLGSSSSFVVGLLHSLSALQGQRITKENLAKEAIRIEQKILLENVGSQDQIASSFGGFNVIHFMPNEKFRVEPLLLSKNRKQELNNNLMLFFTGFSRISSHIASVQVKNISKNKNELFLMRSMVDEAIELLTSNQDIRLFGNLLHKGWALKKSLSSNISNSDIDDIYSKGIKAGAIGGKILGAGGGGFILFFVEPEKHTKVKIALKNLIHVPFEFENEGSQVIYYKPL